MVVCIAGRLPLPAMVLLMLSSCAAPIHAPVQQQAEDHEEGDQTRPDVLSPTRARDTAPLQLSLDRHIQLIDLERSISGLRFGLLVSENRTVDGFDLNLGGGTSHGGNGIQISLVGNGVHNHYNGIQLAGLTNWMHGHVDTAGFQGALLLNRQPYGQAAGLKTAFMNQHGTQIGAQIGVFNGANDSRGVQVGMLNLAGVTNRGLQIAVGNWTEANPGVQIGIANRAKGGLQIGLLNFNVNGFLPVFPIFNF